MLGRFTIDRLPRRDVIGGVVGHSGGSAAAFDANGHVQLDAH